MSQIAQMFVYAKDSRISGGGLVASVTGGEAWIVGSGTGIGCPVVEAGAEVMLAGAVRS